MQRQHTLSSVGCAIYGRENSLDGQLLEFSPLDSDHITLRPNQDPVARLPRLCCADLFYSRQLALVPVSPAPLMVLTPVSSEVTVGWLGGVLLLLLFFLRATWFDVTIRIHSVTLHFTSAIHGHMSPSKTVVA